MGRCCLSIVKNSSLCVRKRVIIRAHIPGRTMIGDKPTNHYCGEVHLISIYQQYRLDYVEILNSRC